MPNQFTHPWTSKDTHFLKGNFNKLDYKDLGKLLNKSYSSVQSKIRNLKLKKRINKHEINSNFFKLWSHEMAYVLGFITADGNLQQKRGGYHLHIASDDIDVIEKIKKCLDTATPIRTKSRVNKKISYSLRFSDKSIFSDLIRLGVTPRKSLTVKPPKIPTKYVWDYIRGFFDGDGCVYIGSSKYQSNLHVCFYTASLPIAKFLFTHIKKNVEKYDGNILRRRLRQNYFYRLHFGQKNSEVIFKYMYNYASLYMNRKYQIFQTGIKHHGS